MYLLIHRSWWLRSTIIIVLIIVAGRVLSFKTGTLERITSCAVYPFLVIQHKIIQPIKQWQERKKLYREVGTLLEHYAHEYDCLLAENIELKASLEHMHSCVELIDFRKKYRSSYTITAQVLLKNFSNQEHFFLLDAGTNRGVERDMVVIDKNCLIGRVHEVYPYYCKVVLITDRSCKIGATCMTTHAQGIHEGLTRLDETTLTFISHLETLQTGDLVVSTGDGLIFPKGFALGKIKIFEPDGFHYKVTIEPLRDMRTITACTIIQKGAEYVNMPE